MKYLALMELFKTRITIILIIFFGINSQNILQAEGNEKEPTREELKLRRLNEKVEMARLKVVKYQSRLDVADSLIEAGKRLEKDGMLQMYFLMDEEKSFIKSQNKRLKKLNKALKNASPEEVEEVREEIKALDKEYKEKIRNLDKRINTSNKNMDKGYFTQEKGKTKVRLYKQQLKEAEKDLELAEKNLSEYQESLEMANN